MEEDKMMTSKELRKEIDTKLMEVGKLEEEYTKTYRLECAENIGATIADCSNCAYSCVMTHDEYGYDACLFNGVPFSSFCCSWTPETKVSAWLRDNHQYDDLVYRLTCMWGDDLLRCDDVNLVSNILQSLFEVRQKAKEKNK
jgi:hypothetical protein